MKIFFSWSGSLSETVALAFKEWLPPVLQNAKPWMSSTDIARGVAWYNEIKQSLAETDIGLLFVTRENQHAEWLLFEAGALGKGLDTARICTILIDCEQSDISGPLSLFQGTEFTKPHIGKLLQDLNRAMPEERRVEAKDLDRALERSWADLDTVVSRLIAQHRQTASETPSPTQMDLLKEILQTVRDIRAVRHSGADTEAMRALMSALGSTVGRDSSPGYKGITVEFGDMVRAMAKQGAGPAAAAQGIFLRDGSLPGATSAEAQHLGAREWPGGVAPSRGTAPGS